MINAQTVTTPNGNEMTQTDLDLLSGSELVSLYNLSAENMEEKTVRKFKDLATGKKRTWAILEKYTTWITEYEEVQVDAEDEDDFADLDDEPKEKPIVKKPKKQGVGNFIKARIKDNLPPKAIIALVQQEFPDSKATTKDVAWYKTQLNKEA